MAQKEKKEEKGCEAKERQIKRKKRNHFLRAFAATLFFIGLFLFLYPKITNLLYKNNVRQQKANFEKQVAKLPSNQSDHPAQIAVEPLYQELKKRNEALFADKQTELKDPFSYEQPDIDLSAYGLEGNTIGFLSIPKMKIELPILLGANNENMKQGAVHLTQTSYPVGGENTNCVLAAHRGYSRSAMFRDIEQLEIGDKINLTNFRETLTYQVTEVKVISPTDVQELLIQEGRDLITLITCHPYRYNYQRYVVFCERITS